VAAHVHETTTGGCPSVTIDKRLRLIVGVLSQNCAHFEESMKSAEKAVTPKVNVIGT